MIGAKPWMRMKREMESEISPEVAGRERSISATAARGVDEYEGVCMYGCEYGKRKR